MSPAVCRCRRIAWHSTQSRAPCRAEMVASLVSKKPALAAWNAMKDQRVGNDQVLKAEAQRLRRQFENIWFAGG